MAVPTPERAVRATERGTAHDVLSWFSADFGAAAVTNAPGRGSHWHQAFYPLPDGIAVDEGDVVTVRIDDAGRASVRTAPEPPRTMAALCGSGATSRT